MFPAVSIGQHFVCCLELWPYEWKIPILPVKLALRLMTTYHKIVMSNKMAENELEVNWRCMILHLPFAKLPLL